MNDDVKKLSDKLIAFPEAIHEATTKTEDLREQYLLTDARKDYESARAFLSAKAQGMTEGQCKATATETVYETSQEVVKMESAFRRALADQVRIENEFAAIRKIANLQEAVLGRLGHTSE
jgi:hypothetical protein